MHLSCEPDGAVQRVLEQRGQDPSRCPKLTCRALAPDSRDEVREGALACELRTTQEERLVGQGPQELSSQGTEPVRPVSMGHRPLGAWRPQSTRREA